MQRLGRSPASQEYEETNGKIYKSDQSQPEIDRPIGGHQDHRCIERHTFAHDRVSDLVVGAGCELSLREPGKAGSRSPVHGDQPITVAQAGIIARSAGCYTLRLEP